MCWKGQRTSRRRRKHCDTLRCQTVIVFGLSKQSSNSNILHCARTHTHTHTHKDKSLFIFVGDRHRLTMIRSNDRLIESTPITKIGYRKLSINHWILLQTRRHPPSPAVMITYSWWNHSNVSSIFTYPHTLEYEYVLLESVRQIFFPPSRLHSCFFRIFALNLAYKSVSVSILQISKDPKLELKFRVSRALWGPEIKRTTTIIYIYIYIGTHIYTIYICCI